MKKKRYKIEVTFKTIKMCMLINVVNDSLELAINECRQYVKDKHGDKIVNEADFKPLPEFTEIYYIY